MFAFGFSQERAVVGFQGCISVDLFTRWVYKISHLSGIREAVQKIKRIFCLMALRMVLGSLAARAVIIAFTQFWVKVKNDISLRERAMKLSWKLSFMVLLHLRFSLVWFLSRIEFFLENASGNFWVKINSSSRLNRSAIFWLTQLSVHLSSILRRCI